MATPISIREVCKEFASHDSKAGRTLAVDHISLDVARGELFFLLGPSGCGKTTLLRMIAGFTPPTRGRILFGERDVTDAPPNQRNTGMVFQSYALWPHMTVQANVEFGLSVRKTPANQRRERAMEALAAVRMEQYAQRKPNQLSGGQQQRVALARALVIRPDVLLLDEPLSNLDAKLRIDLRSEIRRICKEAAITTVYVTHDQKEALSMADRVAILNQGRVVQLGAPGDLYRRPASRFVAEFLGETNFIQGSVAADSSPPTAVIHTKSGSLSASGFDGASRPASGAVVVCSIRPESIRFAPSGGGTNRLRGRVLETTYLGELAQHIVQLQGGDEQIRVSELNPRQRTGADGLVDLAVEPEDVIVLPQ